MPPKRQVCNLHLTSKSGCRFGAGCKFLHAGPAGSGAKTPASTNRPAAPSGPSNPPPRPAPPASSPAKAPSTNAANGRPPNACGDFWTKGTCDRMFDCRYKHITPSESASSQPAQAGNPLNAFIQDDALDRISSSSDLFSLTSQQMTPAEAHNHMTLFLRDGYVFRTSRNMHSFATVLSSANAESESWQLSDGQSFLSLVSKLGGNGVLRIGEIFRHENVSIRAGDNSATLSFQRGYVMLLTYLSSQFVVKSAMHHDVNSLYGVVDVNFDHIAEVITQCMMDCVAVGSFAEQPLGPTLSGAQLFKIITTVLTEYAMRFKHAVSRHPKMHQLVLNISSWFQSWEEGVSNPSGRWTDAVKDLPQDKRAFLLSRLRQSIESLVSIVGRAEGATSRREQGPLTGKSQQLQDEGLLIKLELTYVGPGDERVEGPRHDNDHVGIADIKIAPTQDELTCEVGPYLPANLPGAPHHLPADSMERLFDIQFRLLREELIAPVKSAISVLIQDLLSPPAMKTQLDEVVKKKGGLYRGDRKSMDSVTFSVYTSVQFEDLDCHYRHGLSVELSFDAPTGKAQSPDSAARKAYWESVGKKRLMQGCLVALVWRSAVNPLDIQIHLGTVTSNLDALVQSAKASQNKLRLKVSFFDKTVDFKILQMLQNKTSGRGDTKFLVEAPVMFESIRPFLQTLQSVEPSIVPFSQHLAHPLGGSLKDADVPPPGYATRPGFIMDLSSLFDEPLPARLHLRPTEPESVETARKALKLRSRLDPSQADAVLDSLTREISLIQGPPGTGKSYTGVELIRVLIANKIRPIILIAFTNHALDHLLSKVLEAGITRKIVRLGSRSNDERISEFSLEKILSIKTKDKSQADRAVRAAFRTLKETEEQMKDLMKTIISRDVKSVQMEEYLAIRYPDHFVELEPPSWISELFEEQKTWSEASTSFLDYWRACKDIEFLDPPKPAAPRAKKKGKGKKAEKSQAQNQYELLNAADEQEGASTSSQAGDATPLEPAAYRLQYVENFFRERHYPCMPPIPSSNRPLQDLLQSPAIWRMSRAERRILHDAWVDEVRIAEYERQALEFSRLQELHADSQEKLANADNQMRLQVLRNAELIGCTTNGAAKLTSLLTSLEPRVLLVEEAGQVLEAHILASLVPSIQSMVLIGDPKQLRPTLANYHLSMDNNRTGKIYRFDLSLMERLNSMGFHMSQLEVQRRMQPSISDLIRKTLYPSLKDHDVVKQYPKVQGFAKNVFFLSHKHAEEGGGDESVSKSNPYEVSMVKDLVMHLLRQGIYSTQGSIVVLCAYLGQLTKIRKALSKEVTTVIDERDELLLLDHEEELDTPDAVPKTVTAEQVTVTKRVILRTVDNFQGEEGDVVILSLVRNSGEKGADRPSSVGFLKSTNRTNVALSRAKHGLFILGNADDLATYGSTMWRGVIEELRRQDHIGAGFPICCTQHPDNVILVDKPGMISQYAPDGGCLVPCGAQLPCGHQCPWKCHSDDPRHISVKCQKNCQRLCPRYHPCKRQCFQTCGACQFVVKQPLPRCGHVNDVKCHQLDTLEGVTCSHLVRKKLPQCEHYGMMPCGMEPEQFVCQETCGVHLSCCRKSCAARCGSCQALTQTVAGQHRAVRKSHVRHKCTKPLYCQHLCDGDCSEDHDCTNTICTQTCRQRCSHHICLRPCSEPCPPCVEPTCEWRCDHQQCPVACGSVCARVPCDLRCSNYLACGHRCPSVCGEDCDTQICPLCADENTQTQVVDLIMGTALSQIDPNAEDLDELLITLTCGHVFTVETLDGTCSLNDYYTKEGDVWTGLAQPPEGLQKPPVCPTCRNSISARRYGRIFKRANLDMLEQHSAGRSRRALDGVMELHQRFKHPDAEAAIERSLTNIRISAVIEPAPGVLEQLVRVRKELLNPSGILPLPVDFLNAKIGEKFSVPKQLATAWGRAVEPLVRAYDGACNVAAVKSSNSTAYQAAFATLFRLHLDQLPDRIPAAHSSPEAYAHEKARIGCGQAPPRADLRFRVESLWATINIRIDLFKAARVFLSKLKSKAEAGKKVPDAVTKSWSEFIMFIINSACNDCNIAIRIATESNSHRQIVRSTLLLLRATFEAFSERSSQDLASSAIGAALRTQLVEQATAEASRAKQLSVTAQREYRRAMAGGLEEQERLKIEFTDIADMIIEEWLKLIKRLRNDTFYQEVKESELEEIQRAFAQSFGGLPGFTTRGHWYTCPNGHLYVIGDCGGANGRGRCPECGATVGGANHRLDATNRPATFMEDIARRQGLGASPYRWNNNV